MYEWLLHLLNLQRIPDHAHRFVPQEPMAKTGHSVQWAIKCGWCGELAVLDDIRKAE